MKYFVLIIMSVLLLGMSLDEASARKPSQKSSKLLKTYEEYLETYDLQRQGVLIGIDRGWRVYPEAEMEKVFLDEVVSFEELKVAYIHSFWGLRLGASKMSGHNQHRRGIRSKYEGLGRRLGVLFQGDLEDVLPKSWKPPSVFAAYWQAISAELELGFVEERHRLVIKDSTVSHQSTTRPLGSFIGVNFSIPLFYGFWFDLSNRWSSASMELKAADLEVDQWVYSTTMGASYAF